MVKYYIYPIYIQYYPILFHIFFHILSICYPYFPYIFPSFPIVFQGLQRLPPPWDAPRGRAATLRRGRGAPRRGRGGRGCRGAAAETPKKCRGFPWKKDEKGGFRLKIQWKIMEKNWCCLEKLGENDGSYIWLTHEEMVFRKNCDFWWIQDDSTGNVGWRSGISRKTIFKGRNNTHSKKRKTMEFSMRRKRIRVVWK